VNAMLPKLARKIAGLLGMLLAMSLIAFFSIKLIPGDPIMAMLGGTHATQATIDRLMHLYGLDLPLWQQYLQYFNGLLHGNLGLSYFEIGQPVNGMIGGAFLTTLKLALFAFPFVLFGGTGLGVAAAHHKDGWADVVVSALTVFVSSVPQIAIGSVLILVLGLELHWLPVAGFSTFSEAILPVCLTSLWPTASLAKLCRACMLEELTKGYILTARAKGLSNYRVLWRHAFPNTLAPLSTSIGLIFGHLLEGSFISETLFNIPGLGRVSINAIAQRDYPVILAAVLLATLIYGTMSFIVDMGYAIFDPRLGGSDE
jgi:ABC-type dipeptide/oligopeptide/nickel transport system permease component